MRVFLAEDSLLIRQRLAKTLSSLEGIQIVGEARSARDATDSILELKPDVVILDIQLRGGTGVDVLQNIKKEQPSPVVIIVTNFPEYRNKCLHAGADYFFDKSTEFNRILLVVGPLLKQMHRRHN
jgi:DNA-binding NarL/FixJ family response regulator